MADWDEADEARLAQVVSRWVKLCQEAEARYRSMQRTCLLLAIALAAVVSWVNIAGSWYK